VIEATPKTSIPVVERYRTVNPLAERLRVDQLRLSGLPQRHDHPREACLLSRQGGWQDAAHGPETTVQPDFT
jgi:hypothetical protein